jgi:Cation efflux family
MVEWKTWPEWQFVLTILASAIIAGYESIQRLLNPQDISYVWAVIAASIIGFLGNEAVAMFRIRVGREISSAALIADGYHARVDGWTSLAVLFGAIGVWLGYPLADPIIGLLITAAIFGIVVVRKQLRRGQMMKFFEALSPCLIGMEACATAHYWARELTKRGHEVRLMPAKDVKA